jgi:hypothetical protein
MARTELGLIGFEIAAPVHASASFAVAANAFHGDTLRWNDPTGIRLSTD